MSSTECQPLSFIKGALQKLLISGARYQLVTSADVTNFTVLFYTKVRHLYIKLLYTILLIHHTAMIQQYHYGTRCVGDGVGDVDVFKYYHSSNIAILNAIIDGTLPYMWRARDIGMI